MIPQSQVAGVTYNSTRKRWIAQSKICGYHGSYVDQGDAEEAMKSGMKTNKATIPSNKAHKVLVDEHLSLGGQRLLSRGWS